MNTLKQAVGSAARAFKFSIHTAIKGGNKIMLVNNVVTINHSEPEMPRLKVTAEEIQQVKRAHIERNLLYTPEEAGHLLGKSPRTVLDLVKEGRLVAADDKAKRGKNGLSGSNGLRITATSVEEYRKSITIPPDKWNE